VKIDSCNCSDPKAPSISHPAIHSAADLFLFLQSARAWGMSPRARGLTGNGPPHAGQMRQTGKAQGIFRIKCRSPQHRIRSTLSIPPSCHSLSGVTTARQKSRRAFSISILDIYAQYRLPKTVMPNFRHSINANNRATLHVIAKWFKFCAVFLPSSQHSLAGPLRVKYSVTSGPPPHETVARAQIRNPMTQFSAFFVFFANFFPARAP